MNTETFEQITLNKTSDSPIIKEGENVMVSITETFTSFCDTASLLTYATWFGNSYKRN
jgi:translation elongation factor P/translation initiation factor 5A